MLSILSIASFFIKIMFFKCKQCIPAGIYLLKVNNRNTRTRCEICSKLTINRNTRTRCEICSKLTINIVIVNFEQVSQTLHFKSK